MTPLDLARLAGNNLLLSLLLKGTLLLALAWLLHGVLRRGHPRLRILLWRCVLGALVLLPLLAPLPPIILLSIAPPPPAQATAQIVPSSLIPQPVPASTPFTIPSSEPRMNESFRVPISFPVEPASFLSRIERTPALLALLWFLVVACKAMRIRRGREAIESLLRRSRLAPHSIHEMLLAVQRDFGHASFVRVLLSSEVQSPFLYSRIEPVILLPERMAEPVYQPDLPGILAHEISHIRHRDLIWKQAVEWIGTFLWFHPLTWKMGAVHDFACEEYCDAVAAHYIGDRAAYSQTLARVALETLRPLPSCAGISFAQMSEVRRRLLQLQSRVRSTLSRRQTASFVATVALMMAGVAGLGVVEAQPPAAVKSDSSALTDLARSVAQETPTAAPAAALPAANDSGSTAEATFHISGRVVNEASAPLAYSAVIAGQNRGNRIYWTAFTQSNTDGEYNLTVTGAGQWTIQSSPSPEYLRRSTMIVLSDPSQPIEHTFNHVPAPLSIQGRVVDKYTKAPIADATAFAIPIYKDSHPDQTESRAWTDADGRFVLSRIAEGYFAIGAEARGYIPLSPSDNDETPNPYLRIPINERTQKSPLAIELEPGRAARIRVLDADRNPVEGARVNLSISQNMTYYSERITDENGECLYDTLPPGFAVTWASHPEKGEMVSAAFETGPQENPVPVEIVLPHPASISGRVTDAQGNPVTNRRVNLMYSELQKRLPQWRTGGVFRDVRTDTQGYYTFSGCGVGEYTVTVRGPEDEPYPPAAQTTLDLREGERREDVNFALDGTVSRKSTGLELVKEEAVKEILFRVYSSEIRPVTTVSDARVSVMFKKDAKERDVSALTDRKGEAVIRVPKSITGLRVDVAAPGHARVIQNITPTVDRFDIILPPAGRVTGKVIDAETGESLPASRVTLSNGLTGSYRHLVTLTGEDGAFVIEDIQPQEPKEWSLSLKAEMAGYLASSEPVMITADSREVSGVVLKLRRAQTLSGTVTGADGRPVSSARVSLLSSMTNYNRNVMGIHRPRTFGVTVLTDGDGHFNIPGISAEGDTLFVEHPDYAARTFYVDPNQVKQGSVSVPLTTGGTVIGRLLDAEGKPLPEVFIDLFSFPENLFLYQTQTDAKGEFKVLHVSPGFFHIRTVPHGLDKRSEGLGVEVREGETVEVSFADKIGAVLYGVTTKDGRPIKAWITLQGPEAKDLFTETESDEKGWYTFENLTPGRYALYFSTAIPRGPDEFTPKEGYVEVEIAPGQTEYRLDWGFKPLPVRFRLIDNETEAPMPNVTLVCTGVFLERGSQGYKNTIESNEEGNAEFSVPKAGVFQFAVAKRGYSASSKGMPLYPTAEKREEVVMRVQKQPSDRSGAVQPERSTEELGRVLTFRVCRFDIGSVTPVPDDPISIPNALISVTTQTGAEKRDLKANTDENGNAVINVPDGSTELHVTVSADGYSSAQRIMNPSVSVVLIALPPTGRDTGKGVDGEIGGGIWMDFLMESGGAPGLDSSGYLSVLNRILLENWRPPATRPPERKTYTSILQMTINGDGTIGDFTLIFPSGWPALDQSVLEAVRRSSPLQQMLGAFKDGKLRVTIPFRFTAY